MKTGIYQSKDLSLCILLVLSISFLSIILFSTVVNNEFVSLDDEEFVTENVNIQLLSLQNVKTIFTERESGHYYPITSISYTILYHFFSNNPLPYHTFNLFIHIICTILVFYLSYKLSNNIFISGLTSILFAIHPMHVESVVWIAALNNLLSSFFFLTACILYLNYQINSLKKHYIILSFIAFTFALLSKSGAMTFCVLLFAFDIYYKRNNPTKIIIEKIAFFVVAISAGIIAILSAKSFGSLGYTGSTFSIIDRFFMFCYSLSSYVIKLFVPFKLSVIHTNPIKTNNLLPFEYYISSVFVVALLLILLYLIKKHKNTIRHSKLFLFGIVFFFITISIYLQIIPVGNSIICERYSYIPYVGLFISLSILLHYFSTKKLNKSIPILIIITIILFSIYSWKRTRVWKNNETLFTDVIKKYPKCSYAYFGLGGHYYKKSNYNEALILYNKAININTNFSIAYNNRGIVNSKLKIPQNAISDFNNAIRLNPDYTEAYLNRANLMLSLNLPNKALIDFRTAISLNNKLFFAHYNIANILKEDKDYITAIQHYNNAINLNPYFHLAYNNRGITKYLSNDLDGAMYDYTKTISIQTNFAEAYHNRAIIKYIQNNKSEACIDWESALNYGYRDSKIHLEKYCKK